MAFSGFVAFKFSHRTNLERTQIFFSLKFEDQGEMRLQALRNLDAFPRAKEHLLKKS